MHKLCSVLAVISVFASNTCAVNGIAVSCRYSGTNQNLYGGFGKIYRYTITNDASDGGTAIYDGAARYATLRSDGQMVAFICQSGNTISVVSVNGGTATQVASASTNTGYLDWPSVDGSKWLYFSMGGYSDDGSKTVKRVNVNNSSEVQTVVTFNCRQWLWGIALDGDKCTVRPSDNTLCSGMGHVYRHQFSWGGTLNCTSSNDVKRGESCGNAISPAAAYICLFPNTGHNSINIYNWDKSLAGSFTTSDATSWGTNMGSGWNRTRWACNSEDWICTMQGWGGRDGTGGSNQVMYDWKNHKQLVATNNSNGSNVQAEAGDFWVGTASLEPVMNLNPTSLAFSAVEGGSNPAAKNVTVTNVGGGTLAQVSTSIAYSSGSGWLSTGDPTSSGNTQTITNNVNISALTPGDYGATVTVSCSNASSKTYAVSVTVDAVAPVISLNPTSLSFAGEEGGANPSAKPVAVTNSGNGTLAQVSTSIAYASGSGWLSTTDPSSGGNSQTISNSVSLSGLADGSYSATVTVSCGNASSKTYTVQLTIAAGPVFTAVIVSPSTATLQPAATAQLTAVAQDQYGAALAPQPAFTWKVGGGGTISTSGLFTAGSAEGGPYTVTATADVGGTSHSGTAEVSVAEGTQLPTGYLKELLSLRNGSSMLIPNATIDTDYLGGESDAPPTPGEKVSIAGRQYTWTIAQDSDGMWADNAGDDEFGAYWAITIVSPDARTVYLKYRNDDDLKIWVNGSLVVSETSWDGGGEKTSNGISLAKGPNRLLFKLAERTGGNHFAVRIVDGSGRDVSDLAYNFSAVAVEVSPITLIAPKGGEAYVIGDVITVRWTADTSKIKSVQVMLSVDGGLSFHNVSGANVINVGDANWGSLDWTIPKTIVDELGNTVNTVSSACKIKVWDPYGDLDQDVSGIFTISDGTAARDDAAAKRLREMSFRQPSAQEIVLTIPGDGAYFVEILGANGARVVRRQGRGAAVYCFSRGVLPAGVYFLRASSGSRRFSRMFLLY